MLSGLAGKLTVGASLLLLAACNAQPDCVPHTTISDYKYTFDVYFEFGKATIWNQADKRLREDVETILSVTPDALIISGYTDTAGSPAVNLKLSKQRAQSVAALFIEAGFPKEKIEIIGFGEKSLMVPTGDNVREVQNRRVEIKLINPKYGPSVKISCVPANKA